MSSATDVISALDVALRVAAALDAVGSAYFIGGSLASSLQGEPRATNDVDIVVEMGVHQVPAFTLALGDDFEVDEEMLRDALRRGRCANIFYLPVVTKVDLFALGPTPYDEVEFARRRRLPVREGGAELYVKAPEDTVLRKLLWYREGGMVSSKQWRDVIEVLRVSARELDGRYLTAWAARLGLEELLGEARGEAASGYIAWVSAPSALGRGAVHMMHPARTSRADVSRRFAGHGASPCGQPHNPSAGTGTGSAAHRVVVGEVVLGRCTAVERCPIVDDHAAPPRGGATLGAHRHPSEGRGGGVCA